MVQVAQNLTDVEVGFLHKGCYVSTLSSTLFIAPK